MYMSGTGAHKAAQQIDAVGVQLAQNQRFLGTPTRGNKPFGDSCTGCSTIRRSIVPWGGDEGSETLADKGV